MSQHYVVQVYKLHVVEFIVPANAKIEAIESILAGKPAVVKSDTNTGIAELYGETVRELIGNEKDLDSFCEEQDIGMEDRVWGIKAVREA